MQDVSIFIDSNVFLYARDLENKQKSEQSNQWLRRLIAMGAACTNLQVLNEVTHAMLRKRRDLQPETIFAEIDGLSFLGSSSVNGATMQTARALHLKYHYSWWDCLLLASALNLGCTHFLSEDLQDQQKIEGLTIVSPFAHTPDQILVSR